MSTIQILLSLYFAFIGTYLCVILSKAVKRNERLLRKIDESFRKMDERGQMAQETEQEGIGGALPFSVVLRRMNQPR